MPNHVKSIIEINGSKENIEKVKNRIINTEDYIKEVEKRNENLKDDFKIATPVPNGLSLNRLIPMPTNIFMGGLSQREEELYGENNWYDWRIKNWGTKWDCYDVEVNVGDDFIAISFKTAWSAPLHYMNELAKVCSEEGCEMTGIFSDEDFASNMGIYCMDDDGSFSVEWREDDAELYDRCWGWNPLMDADEFDEEEL